MDRRPGMNPRAILHGLWLSAIGWAIIVLACIGAGTVVEKLIAA